MSKIRFIDVIRVLGLLLVLTYHLFKDILPGGFLGVDIFFTFSGYLITSLIISTFCDKGNFTFITYIKRRFSRIFPPLFFSLIFTLPFAKLISPDFLVNIDKQVTASLGFITNYFEILSGGSYESRLVPHLYLHTWSLAIEFHYYIVWGILALLFSFIFSKSINKNKWFRISLLFSSIVLTVLSYFNMQYLFLENQNQSVAYWSSTSHMYSFFIGSILGNLFGLKLSDNLSKGLKNLSSVLKVLAFALLPVTFFAIFKLCQKSTFDDPFTYKYGFLIISLLSCVLIFITRTLHEIVSEKLKEPRLINHIANISYPMYLFHWPLFIIFSNIPKFNFNPAICTIACSYILSVFTFYIVEPIFYKSKYSTKNTRFRQNAIIACVVSVICIFLSCNTIMKKPAISLLEEEQMVGNIIQSIDEIDSLKQSINNTPAPKNPKDHSNKADSPTNNDLKTKGNEASATLGPEADTSGTGSDSDNRTGATDPAAPSDTNAATTTADSSLNAAPSDTNAATTTADSSLNAAPSDTNAATTTAGSSLNAAPSDTNAATTTADSSLNAAPSDTNDATTTAGSSHNDKNTPPSVTIIGDSVTLGARKKLLETIPNSYVDAKGSRPLHLGFDLFKELQQSGTLGDYVVIALGTNGIPAYATYINKFINELPKGHRLIFVTPYDGRWTNTWNSYKTTQYLRSIQNKYDFVTIADWAANVSPNPAILGSDKIHIGGNTAGIKLFVETITSAIEVASTKNAKE